MVGNQQKSITDKLREHAEELLASGVSLYSLAQECRVNYAVLYKWLNPDGQNRNLRGDSIDKLASYLGLTLVPISDAPAKPKRKAAKKVQKKKATK